MVILLLLLGYVVGALLGYCLGYDNGWLAGRRQERRELMTWIIEKLREPVRQPQAVHGYTCGLCSWGRADAPRSEADYQVHMFREHGPKPWAPMRIGSDD